MIPRLALHGFEFLVHQTRTRFPFKYGIASMTEVPHLFVRVRLNVEGCGDSVGLASEGLPPKWFTKNPATTFDQDLPEMLEVIRHAAGLAIEIAARPTTFFDLWFELTRAQAAWALQRGFPPLLAHLGVSLVERAVLDGLCRALGRSLHEIAHSNLLGIRLGAVHDSLGAAEPCDLLPANPLPGCLVRHTVGLADPLTAADLPPGESVNDGLPQDLESCIAAYQLEYFKIKLSGVWDRDVDRLSAVARILARVIGEDDYWVTLDGNENFADFGAFREFWDRASAMPRLKSLWERILVVEQPVHRDRALIDEVAHQLSRWPNRPSLIIDESDGQVEDLPRALELGYDGTSHKNCKGIVKGIANACLLEQRRRGGKTAILTGEDLCNLGPVALLQDLAMMAILGISHVERNGHHYFRGLSPWPADWNRLACEAHPDLYSMRDGEFAALQIEEGGLALGSINRAPFGVGPLFDPSGFEVLTADGTGPATTAVDGNQAIVSEKEGNSAE